MKLQILGLLLVLSIIGNAFFFFGGKTPLTAQDKPLDQLRSQYPLLSQRALTSTYTNELINNFLPLREQLHQIVDPYQDDFAFYFEYIPTGVTIGINEDAEFTAASLLKVPVVMAYFHKKERLGIIDDPVVTIAPSQIDSKFGDVYKKGAGANYSLNDAVKNALQQSDNTSSLVLAGYISDDDYKYIDEGLDIPFMDVNKEPIITAQEYTSILKALYFSNLLNKEHSQYILELLTKTDFNTMLPSGIPYNVRIAHKIGLINDQIYNDCGIIYVPNRPYTLCMISKSDVATARTRMHDVSKAIYDYVANYKISK